jgi:hypothetical protein
MTLLVDKAEPLPPYLLTEASHQKDYWLMFDAFYSDGMPEWNEYVYLDPRDL